MGRAAIQIHHDQVGVNVYGSKHLMKFFENYKQEISEAARKDTLEMNNENTDVSEEQFSTTRINYLRMLPSRILILFYNLDNTNSLLTISCHRGYRLSLFLTK